MQRLRPYVPAGLLVLISLLVAVMAGAGSSLKPELPYGPWVKISSAQDPNFHYDLRVTRHLPMMVLIPVPDSVTEIEAEVETDPQNRFCSRLDLSRYRGGLATLREEPGGRVYRIHPIRQGLAATIAISFDCFNGDTGGDNYVGLWYGGWRDLVDDLVVKLK